MEFEELDKSEIARIETDIAQTLVIHRGLNITGLGRKDYESAVSINTTTDILKNYRALGLSSYRQGSFDQEIPEFMRPFVDRKGHEPGNEVRYHDSRMGYIKELLKEIKKSPRILKGMEEIIYKIFIKKLFCHNGDDADLTNAALHFRQLENNVCNLYTLFCLQEFGPGVYITGIDSSGGVHTRKYFKERESEEFNVYQKIHSHGVVFMNMNPELTGRLIGDNVRWANDIGRLEKLAHERSGLAGFELLRSGIENKEFHSSKPHEILLDKDNVHSITVVDDPPSSVGFLTRFMDGTSSIGYMSAPEDSEAGIVAYNSDYLSNFLLNNRINNRETNFLFDLAGAIARDMFVCVHRDKYYSRGDLGKKKSRPRRDQDRVKWLPRFRINLQQDVDIVDGDVLQRIVTLSPCHVSGHIRRCDNPSQRQIDIARSLGINLPEGYTFVREYERGSAEQLRQYKSRSAFSLLFQSR
jgi:hypothetical protein